MDRLHKNKVPKRVTTAAIPTLLKGKRDVAPLEATVGAERGELIEDDTAWMPATGRTVVIIVEEDCWELAQNAASDHRLGKRNGKTTYGTLAAAGRLAATAAEVVGTGG